jgi:hypothetical protein
MVVETLEERSMERIERSRALLALSDKRLSREDAELRRRLARQGRQQAEVERASAESERTQAGAIAEPTVLAERARRLRQQTLETLAALAANEEEVARVHEDLASRHPEGREDFLRVAEQARMAAKRAREVSRNFGD